MAKGVETNTMLTPGSLLDTLIPDPLPVGAADFQPTADRAIDRAKDRIDGTLKYLRDTGNRPRKHQIVNMLQELSDDLGRAAA